MVISRGARPWIVQGESISDPDAWVDLQRFPTRAAADEYIGSVTLAHQAISIGNRKRQS